MGFYSSGMEFNACETSVKLESAFLTMRSPATVPAAGDTDT